MKGRWLIAIFLALSSGCDMDKAPEATATVESAPVPKVSAPTPTAPDNSEEPLLIGMAEQHQQMALRGKDQIESACRVNNDIATEIVRDADAALDMWLSMKATDYQRVIRQACLNALMDVRGIAYNCADNTYNTYWAAAKERHYKEDIRDCEALIASPPALGSRPE